MNEETYTVKEIRAFIQDLIDEYCDELKKEYTSFDQENMFKIYALKKLKSRANSSIYLKKISE